MALGNDSKFTLILKSCTMRRIENRYICFVNTSCITVYTGTVMFKTVFMLTRSCVAYINELLVSYCSKKIYILVPYVYFEQASILSNNGF